MNKLITLFFISFLPFQFTLAQDKISSHQLLDSPGKTKNHPEQGILPFNAPCSDCEEDLTKRTATRREFYKVEKSGSKTFHLQQSLGAMNYRDADGYWRTIDPVMKRESENVYAARQQPSSVVIDFGNKVASLDYAGKEFRFNKNISLSHISSAGVETNFGTGDWSRLSKTINFSQSIFTVQDFYPGIDLQFITERGSIETNFILKNKQSLADGWLVLNQDIIVPEGLHADQSQTEITTGGKRSGYLYIKDSVDENYFYFKPAHAFDSQENYRNNIEMPYTLSGDRLSYHVPVKWLNDPGTLYPVVIDPYLTTSDSLLVSDILGSGFTSVCDTGGCSYFMNNFIMPAGCEIIQINTWFSYLANLPCIRDDGGFQIIMKTATDTCSSRNHVCLGGIQGACFFWPSFLLNSQAPFDFHPCVATPQCSPYSADFEVKFRRCNWIPIGGCDNTCIASNSSWIIDVVGRTVELTNVSLPQTVCAGNCVNLQAYADWGVPLVIGTNDYTFTWNGTLVGDTINVCPDSTTTYYLVVTDNCGNTDTASTIITVDSVAQSPGFTLFPNDSVCGGTQLTFTANGNDPDSLFQWLIECQTTDTITDTTAVSYTAPNTPSVCTVTMIYSAGSSCQSTETDTFYVVTSSSPSVSIVGSDTVCAGDTGTFFASTSFGGSTPDYHWFLNGVVIPAAITDSISSTFVDGDQLVVEMISNDSCSLGISVFDTVYITVSNFVLPSVDIHTINNPICSGDFVTFTLTGTNAGTNPVMSWFINGLISGSGNSLQDTIYYGDEVVIILISSLQCVLSDTVADTSHVLIYPITSPEVEIFQYPDTVVCVGDTLTFTADVGNVAEPPLYYWYLNGSLTHFGPTFSSSFLDPGDTIMLMVTSSNPCGPDSGYDTVAVMINPIVTPQVSIITSADTICDGDPVTFTAGVIDGGNIPSYHWYLNGLLVGNDSIFTSATLSSTDTVTIWLTISSACALVDSISDSATITVIPLVLPSVTIFASEDTICLGDVVTFVANPIGGGQFTTYQWQINGVDVMGQTSDVFTTSLLQPGDSVSVLFYPNSACTDPDSASDFYPIIVENCLEINENAQSVFSMHPNPANDMLYINFNSASLKRKEILITDVLGKLLIRKQNVNTSELEIDISSLSQGIYLVKVVDNHKEYISRLVVQ